MAKKKKILYIITHFELGGAQKQLLHILRNLNRSKYDIFVYVGQKGCLLKELKSISDLSVKMDPCLVREINPLFDVISFFRILFFIRKNRFDIVHVHSPKASILGRWAAHLACVKIIFYTVHGWPFHDFMNILAYNFYLFLEKISAKITTKTIVVSSADLNIGLRKNIFYPDKAVLVHYGVEIDKFNKIYIERTKGNVSKTVLTISSLKHQKGLDIFLNMAGRIVNKNKDINFAIIGDGPLKNSLQCLIRSKGLNDNLKLLGWQDDISPYLRDSSLFVLTSLWEGLPVALIEAVISGIPIVVSNTKGILDIIKDGEQGIIVNPGNSLEVESACLIILNSIKRWRIIIKENRCKIDLYHWSVARMIDSIESIYELYN